MVTTCVLLGAKATYVGRLCGPQFELADSDHTSEFSVAPSFFTVVVGDACHPAGPQDTKEATVPMQA